MGKKDPCAVFGCNNDRLLLVKYQKYGLSLYISRVIYSLNRINSIWRPYL